MTNLLTAELSQKNTTRLEIPLIKMLRYVICWAEDVLKFGGSSSSRDIRDFASM